MDTKKGFVMRTVFKRRGALFALLLAFALIAAACSSDSDDDTTTTAAAAAETTTTAAAAETTTTAAAAETTTTAAAAETTTTAAELSGEGVNLGMAYDIGGRGDKSFNDSAAAGLDKCIADYGVSTQELEPTAGGENREENLRLLAESGFDLIYAVGFAYAPGVGATAPDFPDQQFALIDDRPVDADFNVLELDNTVSLLFSEQEGSALVGAAAALKSETGTIGFIGGVETSLIKKFEAGYEFGAMQANPDIVVLDPIYLTQPPDFSGFVDPAKGKEAALALFDQGADVVYHAAGLSGQGLFEAAKEVSEASGTQVWGIGVDSDQYNTVGEDLQPYVLTSMLKRVDVAVYAACTSFLAGESLSPVVQFDLGVDGVGYATSGGFVDDIVPQLEEMREAIIAGDLVPPETPEG
jgi:basic membrane protein A